MDSEGIQEHIQERTNGMKRSLYSPPSRRLMTRKPIDPPVGWGILKQLISNPSIWYTSEEIAKCLEHDRNKLSGTYSRIKFWIIERHPDTFAAHGKRYNVKIMARTNVLGSKDSMLDCVDMYYSDYQQWLGARTRKQRSDSKKKKAEEAFNTIKFVPVAKDSLSPEDSTEKIEAVAEESVPVESLLSKFIEAATSKKAEISLKISISIDGVKII